MPIPAEQPRFDQPVVDARGFATQPWMNYWLRMASFLSQEDLSAVVAELQRRVTELEEGQTLGFQIIGDQSISVNGVPQPGHVVIITLQGDQQAPGNTQYYGTGPTGTKGWFPVSGAITVNSGELTKVVGTDGVTTLGLADVADSGAGTLIAITKDAKGRITGSRPATITGTAQQINVANGNAAAGLPTLSLAPEVLSALAEAVTALQPSDVTGPNSVKVTSNGSGGIILQLDNDVATPAALTEYSTNSAGQRGWWRPALFESTGVINGGALSINAGNNARFDMAQAVIGYTDWSVTPTQPTRVLLTVGPFSAQVVTGIATANASYVGIQMPAGTIVQQTSPFTNAQRRTIAQIGVLVHSNNTNINAINDQAATIRAGVNQVGDLMAAIGPLNLTGNIYSANGANLNINKSAGSIFKMGSNFQANNLDPHVVSQGAQTALTFRYRLSNGVEGADTTNINPNQYESAPGVLTAIPILGNQWHVQRINIFQSGMTRIQYGQQLYASAQAAINGILTDAFTTEQNIAENGILRCYLIINRGLLGLLGSATFAPVGKFGALQASSAATPNHNDLPGLQGGTTTERYHLTNAQLTDVGTIPNKYDKTGGTISGRVGINAPNVSENADGLLGIGGSFATAATNSVRALRVDATATLGSGFGFANFDAAGVTDGPNPLDHLIGYQSRPRHAGTGAMTRLYAYASLPTCDGPVTQAFGQYIFDIVGTGAVNNHTGLYIEPLVKATNNYAMWIDGNNPSVFGGPVWPKLDAVVPLGDPTLRFSTVYAATGTINTSDAREKTDVLPFTEEELAAAKQLGSEIGMFKFLSMVEKKGKAARSHVGMTVQRAIQIMQSHGLDPFAYGFICYDQWPEQAEVRREWGYQPAVVDDFGDVVREEVLPGSEVITQHRAAGDRYSFRTSELDEFIIRGLVARLDALEAKS